MATAGKCEYCGTTDWSCISPDYGDGGGAWFRHWCCRAGREVSRQVFGYTKADSYRDAGRSDLAERFGGRP
jgi:hypothetical protein